MEDRDYWTTAPPAGGAGRESAGQYQSPYQAAASKDGVAAYVDRKMDLEGLAGDIGSLVTQRLQSTIPEDKQLIMDLAAQVGALTDEVRQLRRRLDSEPYAVYTCPSGQMKDISAELAEIKVLLRQEPRPRQLLTTDVDAVLADAAQTLKPEAVPPPEPPKEPEPEPPPRSGKKKKKRTAASILGNLLFYVVIIGVVAGAFLAKSGSGGSPTVIAGYSAFTVLSSSMEDTYPKGSLIVTHSVDADELEIGDDITYMVSATSSITHRIIAITEEYLDTGERAFETKGTMNENPDKEPVAAANVVGKVIFCSVVLGQAASFVSANWPILLFAVVVLGVLIAFLRWNFRRGDDTPEEPKKRKK